MALPREGRGRGPAMAEKATATTRRPCRWVSSGADESIGIAGHSNLMILFRCLDKLMGMIRGTQQAMGPLLTSSSSTSSSLPSHPVTYLHTYLLLLCQVDQAALTGESLPVKRSEAGPGIDRPMLCFIHQTAV